MKKVILVFMSICFVMMFATTVSADGKAPWITKTDNIGASFGARQYFGDEEVSISANFIDSSYKIRGAEKSDPESSYDYLRVVGFETYYLTFDLRFRDHIYSDRKVDVNLKQAWWNVYSCATDRLSDTEFCIDLKVSMSSDLDMETYQYGTEKGCFVFTSHGVLQQRTGEDVSISYVLTADGVEVYSSESSPLTARAWAQKGPYTTKERLSVNCPAP